MQSLISDKHASRLAATVFNVALGLITVKKNLEYRQHKYGKTVHVIDRSYIWVLKNAVEYEDRQTLVKLHISVDNNSHR